ncbi:VOC family protein [Qipengyuania marisflavi]|uniref:VOC family protein n=1 Tax=Qipengyuania marisflavi TaxID=2486356 RepID=A0A5S3P732_9SPHN|nr:VOC family protein [Qipengyuania marisflavi]TMM48990.1 VOC family protein [Qipengyuania marisflavi]
MATGQIEHVNITVSDADRSAALFRDLLGWHERWSGPSQFGGRTIHVGSDDSYLAIYTNDTAKGGYAKGAPLNHVGLSVADLDAARQVVSAAGLKPFSEGQYDPGPRSFYFFDWDGIEFEVVSYE